MFTIVFSLFYSIRQGLRNTAATQGSLRSGPKTFGVVAVALTIAGGRPKNWFKGSGPLSTRIARALRNNLVRLTPQPLRLDIHDAVYLGSPRECCIPCGLRIASNHS